MCGREGIWQLTGEGVEALGEERARLADGRTVERSVGTLPCLTPIDPIIVFEGPIAHRARDVRRRGSPRLIRGKVQILAVVLGNEARPMK
jgi:hypothetical protein